MANNPISLLPAYAASTPNYNDLWAIVNAGVTKKISVNDAFMKYGITTLPAGVNTPIANGDTVAQMFANLQAQITSGSGGGAYTGPQSGTLYNMASPQVGAVPLLETYNMPSNTFNTVGQKIIIRGIATPDTGVIAGAFTLKFFVNGYQMGTGGDYFSLPAGDLIIFTAEIVLQSASTIRWYTRYEHYETGPGTLNRTQMAAGVRVDSSFISNARSYQIRIDDPFPGGNVKIQEYNVQLIDI